MAEGRAELTTDGGDANGGVAVLRLVTPPDGEMDPALEAGLLEAVQRVEADPAIRACVLTGGDEGVFVRHYSLAALAERAEAMAARGLTFSEDRPVREGPIHRAMRVMERGGTAYLAALNGTAMGGGFELALACDLRLVEDGPHRFGLPEINLGLLPGAGGTQRLTRALGEARALQLMLLGETLTPRELAAWGLAMACVEGPVLEAALPLARRLAAKPPAALAHIKGLTRRAFDGTPEAAFAAERTLFCDLMVRKEARALLAEAAAGRRRITDEPG